MQKTSIADFVLRTGLALALGAIVGGAPAYAADKLLEETVDFTGTFIFLEAKIPGAIIGVIRNGETVVKGYGEIADGSGKTPDGDTRMRIGSITKVFAGATLASMVAEGLQGEFSFVAFAPSRGVGVFVSINEFSVGGFEAMSKAAIELITELAPR